MEVVVAMCTASGGSTGHVVVGLDACCGRSTHFQVIQGLLDRTMQLLEVPLSTSPGDDGGYYLKASDGEWRECGSSWMCTLWVCVLMFVHMYIHCCDVCSVYAEACVCVCVCVCVRVCVCVCVRVYVMFVCVVLCVCFACGCMDTFVGGWVGVVVCIYVCTCVCESVSSMVLLIFEPTSSLAHWVGKRVEGRGTKKGERGRGQEMGQGGWVKR